MVADFVDAAALTHPRIRLQGAVKSFSGRVVVNVDDLVLGEQSIEGLIGPNGAGKTTLMRMIMHSTPLDRGRSPSCPWAEARWALGPAPHQMARHGVVKSNQVIMDFDKLTIWDSLLLAVAERVRATTPDLRRTDGLREARGRDPEVLGLLRVH